MTSSTTMNDRRHTKVHTVNASKLSHKLEATVSIDDKHTDFGPTIVTLVVVADLD